MIMSFREILGIRAAAYIRLITLLLSSSSEIECCENDPLSYTHPRPHHMRCMLCMHEFPKLFGGRRRHHRHRSHMFVFSEFL